MNDDWKLSFEADVHAMWVDTLRQDYNLLSSKEQEEVRVIWITRLSREKFDKWMIYQKERNAFYNKICNRK
jgi:hypothetical protein